jgi:hypothetical protein
MLICIYLEFGLGCEYIRERKKRGKASRKDLAQQAAAAAANGQKSPSGQSSDGRSPTESRNGNASSSTTSLPNDGNNGDYQHQPTSKRSSLSSKGRDGEGSNSARRLSKSKPRASSLESLAEISDGDLEQYQQRLWQSAGLWTTVAVQLFIHCRPGLFTRSISRTALRPPSPESISLSGQ